MRSSRSAFLPLLCALGCLALACGPGGSGGTATDSTAASEQGSKQGAQQGSKPALKPRGRVLLIGVDGATLRVTQPLIAQKRMPNLGKLAREGISGPLRSIRPMHSPRIWNSVSTGKRPGKHGIYTFVRKDDAGGKHLFTSEDRTAQALWNIASRAGLRVAVINWWTTYPPDVVDGVVVSDHFFPEQIAMLKKTFKDKGQTGGSLVYPESWQMRAEALLRSDERVTDFPDPFTGNDAMPSWINRKVLATQYETDNAVARIALAVEEDFHPDLAIVFLPGVDRVSHWLWGNIEPNEKYPEPLRPDPVAKAAGAEALYAYYQYVDALIGELMKPYSKDDLVMVVSDHGFEAAVSMMLLTGNHETKEAEEGIVYARGKGVPAGMRNGATSVLDVTPSILNWLGIPFGRDMDGRPAAFIEVPQLPPVLSHEGPEIERLAPLNDEIEGELLEQLRGLGYLEPEIGDAVPEQNENRE